MARVRTSGTDAELRLRKRLWREGMRYVLGRKLPGSPDILFVRARVAVFVDGCFWHGCPVHYTAPRSNIDFWKRKAGENRARDDRVDRELAQLGWRVIRVWECEVEEDVDAAATRIATAVRSSALTRAET
jgi:DNA mismatch endonuclease (patch repair protein)